MYLKLVYACDHVLSGQRRIGMVVHYADDGWQLACGKYDHHPDLATIRPTHAGSLFAGAPFLEEMMESLERGWLAEWVDDRWVLAGHDD